ncbi:MAG TPA: phenylacetate--CoA ligase family protein [Rhodospirillales bacterium]|nr:phenylacetate--CoA ligase family protein [Rhodospirillales bacterium]
MAHAYRTTPFYKERLEAAGLDPKGRITVKQWEKIPLLRREDIQKAGKTLHSAKVPPSHGKIGGIFTSGSTGKPIHALRTRLFMFFFDSITLRDHYWQGFDVTKKLAAIRSSKKGDAPYPDGGKGHWGNITGATPGAGNAVTLNLLCTAKEQVDWLQRQNPEYILTLPSNFRQLAEYCLENKIKLPNLRKGQTISEAVSPAVRDICREAWGVELCDIYSAREAGYLALQCPDHGHYHAQSEVTMVEVLNDEGKACEPGEMGRVVVTPLHNFAMPLLRYDIGDYAEAGEDCPCGRGLPVLKRVIGREQGMLVLRSGEKVTTLLGSGDIKKFLGLAPVRQYQFVQKDLETIEVRLAAKRKIKKKEEDSIKEWLTAKYGCPFTVTFVYLDEIEKGPSGKYNDFICEVKT